MSLLQRMAKSSDASSGWGWLVVRLWFGGVLAVQHGWPKMTGLEGFAAGVAKHGFPVPMAFAVAAAASELVGGALIAVGLLTRPAAAAVLGTMVTAAFVVHASDPFGKKEFALCYAAAALAVLIAGPGRFSLDVKLSS